MSSYYSSKEEVEGNKIKNSMNMLWGFHNSQISQVLMKSTAKRVHLLPENIECVLKKYEFNMGFCYENNRQFSMTTIYEDVLSINMKQE